MTTMGKLGFRLQRMQSAYTKDDPPPNRVKPVPVMVIRRILVVARQMHCPFTTAFADMIGLAFFSCCALESILIAQHQIYVPLSVARCATFYRAKTPEPCHSHRCPTPHSHIFHTHVP
jgi:hypothetical protein